MRLLERRQGGKRKENERRKEGGEGEGREEGRRGGRKEGREEGGEKGMKEGRKHIEMFIVNCHRDIYRDECVFESLTPHTSPFI